MSSKIGTVLIDVAADVSKLIDGFNKAQKESKEKSEKIAGYAKNITVALAGMASLNGVNALIRGLIDTADAMNMLDSRLKLATGSIEEFARQQQALYDVSKSSFSDIKDITTLYIKLDPALKQVGASTDGVTKVTSDFAKALKIGGANAQESSSAILQFAQAMGSGVLRGEEFNSIAEASPKLMEYLAKGLGVPQTALRGLAQEGELTADKVSVALLKMSSEIDADFKKLPITVSNATVNLTTDIQKIAQEVDTATGISSSLSLAIQGLSGFMKENADVTVSYFSNSYADASVTAKALSSAVGDIGKSFYDIASPIATFGGNFVDLQDMAVGVVAAFGVVSASVQNAAIVFKNAGLQIQSYKKYFSLDEDREAFIAANDKLITENRKQIKTLEELGQAGIDAGMKLRKAFADNQHAADVRQSAQVYKEFNEQIKDLLKDDFSVEDEIYKIQHSKKAQTQEEIKELKKLQDEWKKESAKLTSEMSVAGMDDFTKKKTDLEFKAQQEIEKYKQIAGAKEIIEANLTAKITELEQEQIDKSLKKHKKLEEDFVNDINALVDKKSSYFLDGFAKEALESINHYNELIEKYKEVEGAEEALKVMQVETLDDINEKIKEQNKLLEQSKLLNSLDKINDRYQKILESQISLIEAGQDWGINFSGDAKNIDNISKSISKMHLISIKYTKADLALQNDYAKKFISANGDIEKEKTAQAEFDEDYAKLNEQRKAAEIAGYSTLAGSISQAFAEGSNAAKAFMAVQQGLALYNSVTAVTSAWASAPFPANLPAVAATSAAVISLLAQVGQTFSGGGGNSSPTSNDNFEANRKNIENTYNPIVDRLDRQIELLESIDKAGSASKAGVSQASTSFERDYKLFVEDTLEKVRENFDLRVLTRQGVDVSSFVSSMERIDNLISGELFKATNPQDWGTMSDSPKGMLDFDVLREGYNLLTYLGAAAQDTVAQIAIADDIHKDWGSSIQTASTQFGSTLSEIFDITAEYAQSMIGVVNDLKDASDTMQEAFDKITGTAKYEMQRLTKAFSDFETIRGDKSYADYLEEQINNIRALDAELDTSLIDLLLSEDPARIQEQADAISALGEVTKQTFEGGAEEALNYIKSIELVADAMASSRENIKSFMDGLKTNEQLAADMAGTLGTKLATTVDELAAMFVRMSQDADGLTDNELELINANKALLENTDKYQEQIDSLNVTLDDVTGSISTLDSVLGVIQSAIDKLRSASLTSEQSLQIFYDAMAEAQALSTTTLYEEYADAIKKASDASSILFNTSAFQTSRDMQFAQLVAANQFEELQNTTLSEVDYLRQIEINTRTQIDVLVEAMNALGTNVSSSLAASINAIQTAQTSSNATASYIQDIYTKYDLHKYQTDTSGYAYWEQQVSSGAVAVQDLDTAIKIAAMERLMYTPFADGGIVTSPTFGLIGEAGYPEAVIPLKNPDDPLNQNALLAEIKALREEVATLLKESNKNQTQISKNTAASRYAS